MSTVLIEIRRAKPATPNWWRPARRGMEDVYRGIIPGPELES